MNNIDKILQRIRSESEDRAAAILSEAGAEAAGLIGECDNRIKDMRLKNAEKCRREREAVLRRARSSADMRRREIMLGARVGLLDKAYAEAESFILNMDRDAYSALLSRLLADALSDRTAENRALTEYGEDAGNGAFEVAFNKNDRDELGAQVITDALGILAGRGEKAPEVTLSGREAKISGGFILCSGDVECDCSVHTLVATSRASTEAEAAQVLFQ